MMTIKNPTSIKNTLERLETMMKEMNAHINEIENRIIDLETQVVSDIDGMLDNIRSDIGNDIQSAVSEINSNIDQLKD
jgi:flagellar hook-associated protein FlgK